MRHTRAFLGDDHEVQHLAAAPPDDTAKHWDGTTHCGVTGRLTWVHPELVDNAHACVACVAVTGTTDPPLEGDDLGPV